MKGGFLLASLATAASSVSAAGFSSRVVNRPQTMPGGAVYEFKDGADTTGFLKKLEQEGKIRFNFVSSVFNGVSFQANNGSNSSEVMRALANHDAVKKTYDITIFSTEQLTSVKEFGDNGGTKASRKMRRDGHDTADHPDTDAPHQMTQVDKVRAMGYDGTGITIGILDTGVAYDHPALGGCFGPGCLVVGGYDFVGDDYAPELGNSPVPDPDPQDCNGHGTHVAGIIAAQENPLNFTGVAPGVKLRMYRVFGCGGSTSTDVLIAASIQAYEDRVDLITASLGALMGWRGDAWTTVVSRIVDLKTPYLLSAGNDGKLGAFASSSAADGPGVVGVAAVDNIEIPDVEFGGSNYTVEGGASVPFTFSITKPTNWGGVKLEVFSLELLDLDSDDLCVPLPDNTPDLSKYIVLVGHKHKGRPESCDDTMQGSNAAAKGANYIIFRDAGIDANIRDLSQVPQIEASASVSPQLGDKWNELLKANKTVRVSMVDPLQGVPILTTRPNDLTGGFVANYSSWGPTFEMGGEPSVSGPGSWILSTVPVNQGSYQVMSGTSMSTPHVAGVMALFMQARQIFDPVLVRIMLTSSALPAQYTVNGVKLPFLAPPFQQGGGLVQAKDAIGVKTLLGHSRLHFNDTEHRPASLDFTITNTRNESVEYEISNVPTATFNTFSPSDMMDPAAAPLDHESRFAQLTFSKTKFTLAPGEWYNLVVSAKDPSGVNPDLLPIWGGFINITGNDSVSLRVSYTGLAGSLRKHAVLANTGSVWMANSTDEDLNPLPANETHFTLPAPGKATPLQNLPTVAFNLSLGTATLHAVVLANDDSTLTAARFAGLAATNASSNALDAQLSASVTSKFSRSIGEINGSPFGPLSRTVGGAMWDGSINEGNYYAPPGNYSILIIALNVMGDPKNPADWSWAEGPPFSIEYS